MSEPFRRESESFDQVAERTESAAPSTWNERGIVLPATTPFLSGARLRYIGNQFELVFRPSVGVRGWYVVPASRLPVLASVSLFDRAVLRVLLEAGLPTPRTLRTAVADAVARGYAGRRVLERFETERKRRSRAELTMLAAILIGMSGNRDVQPDSLQTMPEILAFVRAHHESIASTASGRRLSLDELMRALQRLCEAMTESRILAAATARLKSALAVIPTAHGGEPLPGACAIADALRAAIDVADRLLRSQNLMTYTPAVALDTAHAHPERLVETTTAAAWALNGWPLVVDLFLSSMKTRRVPAETVVAHFSCRIPPLPTCVERECDVAIPPPVVEYGGQPTEDDRHPNRRARFALRQHEIEDALTFEIL